MNVIEMMKRFKYSDYFGMKKEITYNICNGKVGIVMKRKGNIYSIYRLSFYFYTGGDRFQSYYYYPDCGTFSKYRKYYNIDRYDSLIMEIMVKWCRYDRYRNNELEI
jgi:hypothetical protein